eukprot:COSAG02_NODE_12127_length_1592_cov_0.981246_1_plen_116_part_00
MRKIKLTVESRPHKCPSYEVSRIGLRHLIGCALADVVVVKCAIRQASPLIANTATIFRVGACVGVNATLRHAGAALCGHHRLGRMRCMKCVEHTTGLVRKALQVQMTTELWSRSL